MPSIGDTLREARMRQRLDIADVEVRTKIRAKYLRALENEEFDRLPGSTFAKTFLRTYAEVLGLDPQLLVEEYRSSYEPPEENEVQPFAAPQPGGARGGRERRATRPPARGTVIAAAFVALIAFLLVLGLAGGDGDDEGGPAGGGDETQTATDQGREGRSRPRRRRPRPAPRLVTMRLVPPADGSGTYACVDKGPGTDLIFEGIATETATFRGRKLRINLGKPSSRLVVNGKRVKLGEGADPVGFEFSPKGSKPLPGGARPCA